ncbi:MAG: hypothetical protein HKN20_09720 [Gemmatimonadetes bacterium]|nr:hypothetical protein [Gemmatimonadota bacterium]
MPQQVVANPTFNVKVTDYSSTGGEGGEYTPQQVLDMKQSGKSLLAYLSIGEAETYRFYWQPGWIGNPPAWLGPFNPNFPDNFKVRYWMPEWQDIIFLYLDRILAQGFDGVYLDLVDSYLFWDSENPDSDNDMIAFVDTIAGYAAANGAPDFVIVPQNGEFITVSPGVTATEADNYYSTIDAIGVESVFFRGGASVNNPYNPETVRITQLDEYLIRGKPVFSCEYITDDSLIAIYLDTADAYAYVPYHSTQDLDSLRDGQCGFTSVAAAASMPGGRDAAFRLEPSITRSGTTIAFTSDFGKTDEHRETRSLGVYSVTGRLVRDLTARVEGVSGAPRIVWDGRDRSGRGVAAGTYFVRWAGNERSSTGRLVVVR